jgi:hypothetical protein
MFLTVKDVSMNLPSSLNVLKILKNHYSKMGENSTDT